MAKLDDLLKKGTKAPTSKLKGFRRNYGVKETMEALQTKSSEGASSTSDFAGEKPNRDTRQEATEASTLNAPASPTLTIHRNDTVPEIANTELGYNKGTDTIEPSHLPETSLTPNKGTIRVQDKFESDEELSLDKGTIRVPEDADIHGKQGNFPDQLGYDKGTNFEHSEKISNPDKGTRECSPKKYSSN